MEDNNQNSNLNEGEIPTVNQIIGSPSKIKEPITEKDINQEEVDEIEEEEDEDDEQLSLMETPISFPFRLFSLLEMTESLPINSNPQAQLVASTIQWNSSGKSFRILDKTEFCNEVIPKYFTCKRSFFLFHLLKHIFIFFFSFSFLVKKFNSFTRQLNIYGFHKTRRGKDEGSYYHPYFIRGRKDLLTEIIRIPIKSRARESSDHLMMISTPNLSRSSSEDIQSSTQIVNPPGRIQRSTSNPYPLGPPFTGSVSHHHHVMPQVMSHVPAVPYAFSHPSLPANYLASNIPPATSPPLDPSTLAPPPPPFPPGGYFAMIPIDQIPVESRPFFEPFTTTSSGIALQHQTFPFFNSSTSNDANFQSFPSIQLGSQQQQIPYYWIDPFHSVQLSSTFLPPPPPPPPPPSMMNDSSHHLSHDLQKLDEVFSLEQDYQDHQNNLPSSNNHENDPKASSSQK